MQEEKHKPPNNSLFSSTEQRSSSLDTLMIFFVTEVCAVMDYSYYMT